MNDEYFNFDGNKFPIKRAIALIDVGEHSEAFRVLSGTHSHMSPHTLGAVAAASSHPDIEKYQILDSAVVKARDLVGSDPRGARLELLSMLDTFGWA